MAKLPEFRPPQMTGEAARAVQYVADRADIFRAARALVDGYEWYGDTPAIDEVLGVAQFLAGDKTE